LDEQDVCGVDDGVFWFVAVFRLYSQNKVVFQWMWYTICCEGYSFVMEKLSVISVVKRELLTL